MPDNRYSGMKCDCLYEQGASMQSVISSKFQTTIPKAIRENMNLSAKDMLEWTIANGKIIVTPARRNFLSYQNTIEVGKGDIRKDIERARKFRAERRK